MSLKHNCCYSFIFQPTTHPHCWKVPILKSDQKTKSFTVPTKIMLLGCWDLCAIKSAYRLCSNIKNVDTFFFRIRLFMKLSNLLFVSIILATYSHYHLVSDSIITILWIYRVKVIATIENPSLKTIFFSMWTTELTKDQTK